MALHIITSNNLFRESALPISATLVSVVLDILIPEQGNIYSRGYKYPIKLQVMNTNFGILIQDTSKPGVESPYWQHNLP